MLPKSKVPECYCHPSQVGQYNSLPVALPAPFASDFSACLGGSLPALMAGDLNAKHVD
jgi:hypothetical protein